jgi:hypothetical protein
MKSDDDKGQGATPENGQGEKKEKDNTMKTATKKTSKGKSAPKTTARKAAVKKEKTVATRDPIKGVVGLKFDRTEVALKQGHFLYNAGKGGYGIWDPVKGRRVKWIPKDRVKDLIKK